MSVEAVRPSERFRLGVLGTGDFARALARTAAQGDGEPRAVLLGGLEASAGVAAPPALAAGCRLIVLVIGPEQARAAARKLAPFLDGSHLLLHAVRGLEPDTGRRITEVFREETCVQRVGVLAGPLSAHDLETGAPTACVVGSRFDEVVAEAKRLIGGPSLRVYGNRDALGVELAAALGPALVFASGVASGLGFGAVTRAVAVTRGLAEVVRIGERIGAREHTFLGLSGVGTQLARAADPRDPSFDYGERLGRGGLGAVRGEPEPSGPRAARNGARLADESGTRAPLFQALRSLADGRLGPEELARALMERALADE